MPPPEDTQASTAPEVFAHDPGCNTAHIPNGSSCPPRQEPRWGEPSPNKNDEPAIYDLVIQDMQARDKFGTTKYGTRLQPFNGRDPLKDAYEEVLDLAAYLRQLMYERDKRVGWMKESERVVPAIDPRDLVNPFRTQQMTLFDDPDKTAILHVDWKE